MNRCSVLLGIIAVLTVSLSMCARAQDTDEQDTTEQRPLMRLFTVEGERYDGYVLGRKRDTLRFETAGGVLLVLPVSKVETLDILPPHALPELPAVVDMETQPLDRPASSLFVMPTAYPLDPGEVHLGVYELVVATGSVGLGGYADFSLGTILLPHALFNIYVLGIKVSPFSGKTGAVAVGAVAAGYDRENAFMLFGVGTVSIGHTWLSGGYVSVDDGNGGVITLGLDAPASRASRIMAELWIPTEGEGVMFSIGARVETSFMNIDFGFYIPLEEGGRGRTAFLPWLGGTFRL